MTTKATKTTTPLTPGGQITYPVPGTNVAITVARVDNGHREQTYTVTTEQGGFRVDDWTGTFATETDARFEATRTAKIFHTHKTDAGVQRRRNALGATISEQEARKARRMCDHEALSVAYAEAETLMDFATARMARRLTADLANLYAA